MSRINGCEAVNFIPDCNIRDALVLYHMLTDGAVLENCGFSLNGHDSAFGLLVGKFCEWPLFL